MSWALKKLHLAKTEAIESFVAVIQEAIRELRNCYSELVGNIEQYLLKILRLEEVGFSTIII